MGARRVVQSCGWSSTPGRSSKTMTSSARRISSNTCRSTARAVSRKTSSSRTSSQWGCGSAAISRVHGLRRDDLRAPDPWGNREVFETGLAILREWAGNALLTDADIEAERGVVLAELRSGYAAEERLRRQMLLRMFNGSRYAARLPIGTERSLRAMTPDVLRRFYRYGYRPDLQAVIVVGDVNVAEVERSIKALFTDVPAVTNPRPRPARFEIPPRTTLDALVVAEPELPSGHVDLTQYLRPAPSLATVGAYEALLEDQLVNRMLGMRLDELTDRRGRPFLAAQAQRSPIVRGYEAFVASAAIAGQDPVETTRLLATEIERARRFGFTIEELDAAKRDVMNRYAQAAAEGDKSESGSLADELGRHFLTHQPAPGIAWQYERVKQFVPGRTLEAVNDHARIVLEEPGQPAICDGRRAFRRRRHRRRAAARGERGAAGQ